MKKLGEIIFVIGFMLMVLFGCGADSNGLGMVVCLFGSLVGALEMLVGYMIAKEYSDEEFDF